MLPDGTGLRDRRRAETVSEIKEVALRHLADGGPGALALRAVARDVGVSVQALYHYFDSRDALLTALIADSYTALADAVLEATAAAGPDRRERVVAAGLAYRRWAFEHRHAFLLALGSSVPGYAAPPDGPTTPAGWRLGQAFRDVLFDGWTAEELARVPLPDGALRARLATAAQAPPALPPGAFAAFTLGWSTLHGLVLLELLGHVPWIGGAGDEVCRLALLQVLDALDAHRC